MPCQKTTNTHYSQPDHTPSTHQSAEPIGLWPIKRQSIQLLPCPPVQLLRLSLPRADKAHLSTQRRQPVSNSGLLRGLKNLESTQSIIRLFQRLVSLTDLLPQHLSPVLVTAQMQVELLLELVAFLRRGDDLVNDLLKVGLAGKLSERQKRG